MNFETQTTTVKSVTISLSRADVDIAIIAAIRMQYPELKPAMPGVATDFDYVIGADASLDELGLQRAIIRMEWEEKPSPQMEIFPPAEPKPLPPATPAVERAAEQAAVFDPPAEQAASPVDESKVHNLITNGGLALAVGPRATDGGWAYSFSLRYPTNPKHWKTVDWTGDLPSKDEATTAAIAVIRKYIDQATIELTRDEKLRLTNAKQALAAREKKITVSAEMPPSAPPKPSTAKKGNPSDASRGAAVDRERVDFGSEIDDALAFNSFDISKPNQMAIVGMLLPGVADPVAAIKSFSLGEIKAMRALLRVRTRAEIVEAIRLGADHFANQGTPDRDEPAAAPQPAAAAG